MNIFHVLLLILMGHK